MTESMQYTFNGLKWGILLRTLPLTLLFGLAKWTIHRLGWEPWEFDSLTASLFGSATFVIAFVLSGTLSDYRASEDMPTQVANAIEAIQDSNTLAASIHSDYDPKPLTQGLIQVVQALLGWLKHDKPLNAVSDAVTDLNFLFAKLDAFSSAPMMARLQGEQAKIRILVTRMQLVRDTDFLAPAYVLLNLFWVGTIAALLLIGADRFSETMVVSIFLFTSFTYLIALIRDLDNPFQYNGKTCVDVDLSVLDSAIEQLQRALDK